MKKVICPVDFSDVSINATAYAAKIAQISNAELILFHEHSLWSRPEEFVIGSEDSMQVIAGQLEEQALQISKAFHISCYADVISSAKPLSVLIEKMEDDIDLIVMGMDRETDIVKDILGSLAFRLIQNIRIPLLLVPENYTFQAIDRIVFAFDPYEKEEIPVDKLVEWANIWKAEIQLLEGVNDPDHAAAYAQGEFSSHGIRIHEVDRSKLIEEIQEFMDAGKANMLALFVRDRKFRQRIFHKSLIQKLENTANVPLFIFH